MTLSVEDLLVPVTEEQQLDRFLTTLENVGVRARSWREAGVYRTILRVVAGAYAGFSQSVLGFVRAGFLEEADGGWLTMLSAQVYGVARIPATFATGTVTLTNAGGGTYTWAPTELRVIHATTGKAYTNLAAETLAPGNVHAVSVGAIEIGTPSNASAGTVTKFETAYPGVTVTNVYPVVGSNDEADSDLRERCRNRLSVISGKGPRGAYAYAVKSALRSDGSPVDINRVTVSPSSSTGVVTVYVASPAGAPAATDLPFIAANVELLARPDSVTATIVAATVSASSRTLIVWAKAQGGLSAADLGTLVATSLDTMVAAYPIGGIPKPPSADGYLYATNIEGAARDAHPSIFAVDGAGADIALTAGQVATLAATLDVRLVTVST
jgi:hypothetical protein